MEEIVKLANLQHARHTDLSENLVNNQDACLIALAIRGGYATSGQLKSDLQKWRKKKLWYTYLFNDYGSRWRAVDGRHPSYGYVGSSSISERNNLITYTGSSRTRRTFWYRTALSRGMYGITVEGFRRLHELNISREILG